MADVFDLRAVEATLNAVPGVRNARIDDAGDVVLDVSHDADEEQVRRDVSAVLTMVFDVPASSPAAHAVPQQRERFTLIRGGLTDQAAAAAHPLMGASPQVPDMDEDMLRERDTTHPAHHHPDMNQRDIDQRNINQRNERLRMRERSPFTPLINSAEPPRPTLVRLRTTSTQDHTTVSVILTWNGILTEGIAQSPPTASAARFATVSATLSAVSKLIPPEITFAVESLAPVELGELDAAVVLITMTGPAGSQQLTGVSLVTDDSRAALARATLDAINRRVSSLLHH